jgi:hypothetical protein
VQLFSDLSAVAQINMRELGVSAGNCMNLGDEADRFIRFLRDRYRSLLFEQKAIGHVMDTCKREHTELIARGSSLKTDVENAVSSQDVSIFQSSNAHSLFLTAAQDFGNAFLGFFSDDTKNRLENDVRDARRRLQDNLDRQSRELERWENFYKLTSIAQLARAAILALQTKTIAVSDAFDVEFKRVTGIQDKEAELWRGLLTLKERICDTDYMSTRDGSLRTILQLLSADDKEFPADSGVAGAESRIKASIDSKLGVNAAETLVSPQVTTANLGDLEIEGY